MTLVRRTTFLTVGYLTLTALLIVGLGRALPSWPLLVLAHLALSAALLAAATHAHPARAVVVLLDWHPLALFPLLYKEVELLAGTLGTWALTPRLSALEVSLFNGQPSLYLSERLGFVPLSEYLHFCYLAYVILIPATAAAWYWGRRRQAFHELIFVLTVVMLGSYLFFILFPVDSPYYRFERLGPPLAGHFFYDAVQAMSSRGGARGGAFPSAHASGAIVLLLLAWRHQRRLAIALVPLILGLLVATVYCRFHYVLDTVAGVGLGVGAVGLCRRACARGDREG